MFKSFFATSDLLIWPLVALAVFFVTFLAVLVWVFAERKNGARFHHVASLPLEGDARSRAREGDGT